MILGYIFIPMGIVFLVALIYYISTEIYVFRFGKRTRGVVVEVIDKEHKGDRVINIPSVPVVEFIDQQGNTIKFRSKIHSRLKVGAKVEVAYILGKPDKAFIDYGIRKWFSYLGLLSIPIIFITLGFLIITDKIPN